MTVVEAPALAGSRRRAKATLEGLPDNLQGAEVTLTCRGLLAAAVSFVDEIVNEVLIRRRADKLIVRNATDPEFIGYFKDRAAAHGVADRLHFS